ncbi:MAG: CoA transferase [Alphaproteobacteria bacterium]|nr:CoA transferase [Alphaproteobacteria bacterium]
MAFFKNTEFQPGPYTTAPAAVMRRVLADVGLSSVDTSRVQFVGGRSEGLIDTNLAIAPVAAGLYGALGVVLDQVGQARGLPQQTITVEIDHAAMAMSKMHWLLCNGKPVELPEGPAARGGGYPGVGNFRCKDGRWINISTAFPGLRNTVLKVLNSPNDRNAIQTAILKHWDSFALEDTLAELGACGAVMRTPEEWAAHPHGRSLLQQPLVQITKVRDSAPRPLTPWPIAPRLLSGVRQLDLTHVLAGPTGTQIAAEAGADVLRIVGHQRWINPIGDIDMGIGKRSCQLSLDDAEQREQFFRLIDEADVFVQGFNPTSIYRLLADTTETTENSHSLGEERLLDRRPGIILVNESYAGPYGPWGTRAGFEQLAQAATGMMYLQKRYGEASPQEGGEPIMTPVYFNDYGTGILSAIGVCVALLRRATEGGSYIVRSQLIRTASLIVEQGTIPMDQPPHSFSRGEVLLRSGSIETPHGMVWALRPVVQLDQTPLSQGRSSPTAGEHRATWLPTIDTMMNAAVMGTGNTYGGGKSWL